MDKYKLKFTKVQNEIFRLMCIKSGTALNQRKIAQELKVSPTSISKSLPLLKNLLKIEKAGEMKLNYISLNRDNPQAIAFKRIENLKLIYESGLPLYLEEKFPGSTIILFGSYALGEDTVKSDLDLAVIGVKEKDIELSEYEQLFERVITLHFYPDLRKVKKELRLNIIKGVILAGYANLKEI